MVTGSSLLISFPTYSVFIQHVLLQDWTDTKAYLKNKQKILRRMKEIQEDETKLPNRKTLLTVKKLMESISEEMVRNIDNSLTPFYLWVGILCV